jgi:hypothetical protein
MVTGNRQYKTKQFTVTVEPHCEIENFYWVRIYANCRGVGYCSGKLLLGCGSGSGTVGELMKKARVEATKRLARYKKEAQAILALDMDKAITTEYTPAVNRWVERVKVLGGEVEINDGEVKIISSIMRDDIKDKMAEKIRKALGID